MTYDPRFDAYIAEAAPFARPILNHLRALVHSTIPDAGETMKWSMPFFEHGGRRLAMMAAFKAHVGFGIFDGTPMASGDGMGQFGKLASVADLPPAAELAARMHAAVALIDAGPPPPAKKAAAKPDRTPPGDLAAALADNPAAARGFDGLPAGARREYVEWVETAKLPATRAKRIATTVAQCAEGRKLHWKYENC